MSRSRSRCQRIGIYALAATVAAPTGCVYPPPPTQTAKVKTTTTKTTTTKAAASQPDAGQPAASQPAASQPAASQPAAGEPAVIQAAQNPPAEGKKTFTQKDLDELLAPIALYPDALLSQVLMASTYPLEVVEAARWQKANPKVKDKALEDALQKQPWDASVKSIVAVPQVLEMMNEKLDWTQKLGDAFLAQQSEVVATVQKLRGKAQEAGTLKTTEEQKVATTQEEGTTVITIEQSNPEVVYVPTYNPAVVYGSWWYPTAPPYYYYPAGYAIGVGLAFTGAAFVGAAMWGGFAWGRGSVNVNVNRYNSFNRTNINSNNWNHNSSHRKGVAYRDSGTAQRYNRGSSAQANQSREQFRGRGDSGNFQGGAGG